MATTLLFAQHWEDDHCLCLKIGDDGQFIDELQSRSVTEIRKMQRNSTTLVVLPTEFFSLHRLELPWLSEKKARSAIPFALEEQLAQSVDDLHFAFDKAYYANGHYLVVVGKKYYLNEIITRLDTAQIEFDAITLDWFALEENESCLLANSLLVNQADFKGTLSMALIPLFLDSTWSNDQQLYVFADSLPVENLPLSAIKSDETALQWLAKRLTKPRIMNLCQGELFHDQGHATIKRWYYLAGSMALIWLISIIFIDALTIHGLNKKIKTIDDQIAVIYRQFFPNAQQIISPKFRITQLLGEHQNSQDQDFWLLLDKLTTISQQNESTIQQLRFQNKAMQVTLATKDFEALETIQNGLQKNKVHVKQTQAVNQDKQVVSTLELNL